LDNFLSNSVRSIERSKFGFDEVQIDRGELLTDEQLDQLSEPYKRYAITESGISPRGAPGHPNAIFMVCSDEHTEYGHFESEDAENRVAQASKRLRKSGVARQEMRGPVRYGPEQADVTLVGWGSTYGPMREAVDRLTKGGQSANALHFGDVWPFPEEGAMPLLKSAKRLVAVEGNATGQFARLLRMQTGVQVDDQIHRFDGRPFSPEYIMDRL
jgi:2-oxoglutarate ferredoxin oxidoreductase subunit alpha